MTMQRAQVVFGVTSVVAALSFGAAALAEGPPLRGIAADLAAAKMLQDMERAGEQNEQTDIALSELTARRLETEQNLRMRVRSLYRLTRAGLAPIAGGFDAVRRHVARIKRMTALVHDDVSALKSYTAEEEKLKAESDRHTKELVRARENLGGSPQPLMAARQPHPAGSLPVTDEPEAELLPKPPSSGSFYGLRFSEPAETSDFASHHGRLATPVAGEVRVVDARRAESQGSGLEFQAPAGTAVRAAAPGRVAFCDRYGSYGRLVIIDHGDSYYTAYGGMGRLEVRVGDEVSAFARLGSIAGDNGTPAVYFEIRKGTKTLAPRAWLGL